MNTILSLFCPALRVPAPLRQSVFQPLLNAMPDPAKLDMIRQQLERRK